MDDETLRAELERHHRESYGWALSRCAFDPVEAEEVLQIVYLKVLDGRARFDGRASFKTWLLALIRNTAADEWRRKNRQQLRLVELDESADSLAPEDAPDEAAHQAQMSLLLGEALAALPARQQEVLRLVFYHDLSVAEAAAVMDVSLGTARTHYDRAKKSLRHWMEQRKVFDEPESGRKENQGTVR